MNLTIKVHLLIEVPAGRVISSFPSDCELPHCAKVKWGSRSSCPPPTLPSLAKGNAHWTGKGAAWRLPPNTASQTEIAARSTTFEFLFKIMTHPSCKGIKLGQEVLDEEPRSLFGSRRLWRVRTSFRVLMWEVKLTQLTAGHGGK